MCGGNYCPAFHADTTMGTSPRVRGKLGGGDSQLFQSRYIPACAGETFLEPIIQLLDAVHPRVCGGNSYIWYTNLETCLDLQFGSSRLTTYSPSYSIKSLVGSPSIDTLWRVGAFGETHVMMTAPWA